MSDLEQRVRQAFDRVEAPADVKRQTLARIEAARAASEDSDAREAGPSSGRPKAKRGGFRGVRFRRALAAAACLAVAAACLGGYRIYAQPTAYVGIDVNPSIELSVNRFGIVVGSEALNEDGAALLESVALANRGYEDALEALTGSEAFAPYAQKDSFLEISVASDDAGLAERLRSQSDACLSGLACGGSCHEVDEKTHHEAAEAGMGMGRYRAAIELMELDPDMTLEDCASLSMRQLRDLIDECEHGEAADESPSPGGHERRHGGSGSHEGRGRAAAEE